MEKDKKTPSKATQPPRKKRGPYKTEVLPTDVRQTRDKGLRLLEELAAAENQEENNEKISVEVMRALRKEKIEQEIRLRKAQAERAEFNLECDKKNYHYAEDVQAMIESLACAVRSGFDGIGAALAVQCAQISAPKKIEKLIQAKVDSVLTILSAYKYDKSKFRARPTEELFDFENFDDREDEKENKTKTKKKAKK